MVGETDCVGYADGIIVGIMVNGGLVGEYEGDCDGSNVVGLSVGYGDGAIVVVNVVGESVGKCDGGWDGFKVVGSSVG